LLLKKRIHQTNIVFFTPHNHPRGKNVLPAIVLSSDIMGLGVIRSLGAQGIPVIVIYHDKGELGYLSKYVKERIFAPDPEEHEEEYLDLLLSCAKRYHGSLLIPTDDSTLVVASRHKEKLDRYFAVACTEWDIIHRIIDKRYTYELANSIGVAAPETLVPESVEDLEQWAEAVGFPALIKPRQSHLYYERFKKKCVLADDLETLVAAYNEAASVNIDVLVQEFIPGDDTQSAHYNSYYRDGMPLVEFTAEKIRLSPPTFGLPRVVMSKDIAEVIEPARTFLRALGYSGYSCTEFKKDPRDGIYKLMEVNGRPNRSGLLALRCGINFPLLEYRHRLHGELPTQGTFREGVYWIDELRDTIDSLKYRKQENSGFAGFLRPYTRPHIFVVLDWRDPKPFLKRCLNALKSALGFNKNK
jgi:predicted ATP-grasp superfamily ATP-dependent carboligase